MMGAAETGRPGEAVARRGDEWRRHHDAALGEIGRRVADLDTPTLMVN
jgi:hypothetical protein